MDRDTRAFMQALLTENAALAEQAGLALAVAAMLQQMASNHGEHYGLPAISPTLTVAALQDCARQLAIRLQPPEAPTNGHDGLRVPVGAATADKE